MKKRLTCLLCVFLGSWPFAGGAQVVENAPPAPPSKEAASRRIVEIARSLPAKPAPDKVDLLREWSSAQVYLRKARFLLAAYDDSDYLLEAVARELGQAETAAAASRSGGLVPWIKGLREEGYYADNDGSFQSFLRYLPAAAERRPFTERDKKPPLLVYLHGYAPDYNIVNWQALPECLSRFAEREGFLVAMPFGRGNTDFQGIGEQDVLRVIEEMKSRYQANPDRVILVGYSMGGTGAWSIGAHHPDLFAGLIIAAGRGDYYAWHKTTPGDLPAWKRRMVDAEFAGSQVSNLQAVSILCAHGENDELVPVDEARAIVNAVKKVNPRLIYREYEGGFHDAFTPLMESPETHRWLRAVRRQEAPAGSAIRPPARLGPVKAAFLSPFVYVMAAPSDHGEIRKRFNRAAIDWYRYAKSLPRLTDEALVTPELLAGFNVFLFGEPETSPLIRRVLAESPVTVTGAVFNVSGKVFPREGNGIFLVRPSPWNPARLAVVQCGIPWGEAIPENHKYDFLPDYIVYGPGSEEDGSNRALCAGFFNEQGKIAE